MHFVRGIKVADALAYVGVGMCVRCVCVRVGVCMIDKGVRLQPNIGSTVGASPRKFNNNEHSNIHQNRQLSSAQILSHRQYALTPVAN